LFRLIVFGQNVEAAKDHRSKSSRDYEKTKEAGHNYEVAPKRMLAFEGGVNMA
jgi:hypothetical protein